MVEVRKVAFLTNEFPVVTETFILNQITLLLDKGIDVKIYALYPGRFDLLHSQYLSYQLQTRVTFIANIPKNPILRIKELVNFFYEKGFLNNFASIVRSLNPLKFGIKTFSFANALFYVRLFPIKESELVHAHFGTMGSFFSKFKSAGLFPNIPFLVSFHGYDLMPNQVDSYRFQYRDLFDQANLITVNSIYLKKLLIKIDHETHKKIKLLPSGIDTGFFTPLTKKKIKYGKMRILFCGRLIVLKGADLAIKIVHRLVYEEKIKDIELIIVGEGEEKTNLESLVLYFSLENHVFFKGSQNQIQIKDLLENSDIFLFPGIKDPKSGRAEAQGLVMQEAQSMRVPVVASDVGGIKYSLINQKTGILCKEGDIDNFVFEVKSLLIDSNRRISMGMEGREFVKAKFDSEVVGTKLIRLYQNLLDN